MRKTHTKWYEIPYSNALKPGDKKWVTHIAHMDPLRFGPLQATIDSIDGDGPDDDVHFMETEAGFSASGTTSRWKVFDTKEACEDFCFGFTTYMRTRSLDPRKNYYLPSLNGPVPVVLDRYNRDGDVFVTRADGITLKCRRTFLMTVKRDCVIWCKHMTADPFEVIMEGAK